MRRANLIQARSRKEWRSGGISRPARHRPIVFDQDRILVVRRRELHKKTSREQVETISYSIEKKS
jgi:hypothetical protein